MVASMTSEAAELASAEFENLLRVRDICTCPGQLCANDRATLRSSYSTHSNQTASTLTVATGNGHNCLDCARNAAATATLNDGGGGGSGGDRFPRSVSAAPSINASMSCLRRDAGVACADCDIDGLDCDASRLRYSFKGFPPELYSPQKEFIYTRPLVEKRLVIKKTFSWWLHDMMAHWKVYAILVPVTLVLVLLSLLAFFGLPTNSKDNNNSQHSTASSSSGGSINMSQQQQQQHTGAGQQGTIADAALPTHYQIDMPDIPTTFINKTFMGDYWSDDDDEFESDIDDLNNNIPDEQIVDYVKPIKVHNFSLNADDLLYESKRKHNSNNSQKDYLSAFSVTGTFRTKSSQIWDPHPEYILNTFGRQLHLVLTQDTSFIPPKTFRVIRILNNRTEEEEEEEGHYLGCYYKGQVQGDEQSAVAVSLCNGMTGYIKTSFGTLLIQPMNQSSSDDADIPHKVWRHARRNARHAVSGDLELDLEVLEKNIVSKLLRKKRNYVENPLFTMEVLLAVDATMQEFHKDDLKSYILTLISIVSNIFSDASIGNSIYISVANILILRDNITAARSGRRKAASASDLLKNFCKFLTKQNYHYDTAMLITRDQICHNERETKCDTLGLAELGTVCKRHSCSIVQDNGLPAAFTIAHELGHILNMPHDDDDRCKPFNKQGGKHKLHIMSSVMGENIHPWSWSDCSRYYVSEFLEKEDKSCLEDTPTTYVKNLNTKQPGEIYSLNHQCQLIHGNQSKYCYIEGECRRLWCKTSDQHSDCRSINLPWADGTPCNNNRDWCQRGKCVPREGNSLQMVNGGWGAWSAFTPCSLTCGGGVQESQRECNNPLPKNGGKYCSGSRKKYRSCNTQTCPPGSLDSREQQCYDQNGRNLNIKGISPSSKWIPKYGLSLNDKCKLYCRLEDDSAYFRLLDKVKDGTTCSFDSFDKCVNGICRPGGCDNELNSIAKLDKCGVCEGRNDTCEEFTGNFYVSDLLKHPKSGLYHYVTTIPKGASNIVITQPGYSSEHYIALSDDQRTPLFNGNAVIGQGPKVVFYAGVTFEYSGVNSAIERVNTTYSRKLKRDLIVEVVSIMIPVNDNDSILISYTYTLDKQNYIEPETEFYRWEMQQWSNCDVLCQGRSHRLPACVSTMQGVKVAPQFCDESGKPKIEYRACNTECMLSLNVSSISECSASCGMLGTREKMYSCIQTFTSVGRSNIVDMSYCELKYEVVRHESCREGCWNYMDWSPCSKTCGTGSQTRGVGCFLNGTRVTDAMCNIRRKNLPDTLRACNTEPCYYYEDIAKTSRSVNHWLTSDWGECDDKCERNRTVTCTHPSHYGCSQDRKPNSKRKCCNIKYVSNWSNCSVDCGTGVRRKEQHCARVYKPEIMGTPRRREIIDDSYCRHLRRTTPRRPQKPCKVSCKWSVSDWTLCPHDCSATDYQTRSVYCESVHGNPINHHYCDVAKKPNTQKICNNCVRRQAKVVTSCNCEGYERRRYTCYDRQGNRVNCPTKEKIFKHKCTAPRNCLPQSCADLQRMRKHFQDGEYSIFMRTGPKKIYCHMMSSSMPKEYITVNPTENYSIYYDYKTRIPDQCPPESRRHEYYNGQNSGRTTFRKIRLNLAEMRVIENDYTFADTAGSQPQPYGSAGDCYNRNKQCPQGDFSMNLKHTGFAIRPGTIWNTYGPSVIMKSTSGFDTSTLSRRAFCGGYCGRCAISPQSGLYLDVV